MIVSTAPTCWVALSNRTPVEVGAVIESVLSEMKVRHATNYDYQFDLSRGYSFIIVDISGSDPNVMFFLGYMLATGKAILPIVNVTEGRVPPALGGTTFLAYDSRDLSGFAHGLRWWVDKIRPSLAVWPQSA